MPLPGDLATITVTGTFLDPAGNPASGTVTFDPGTVTLTDATGHAILAAPVTITLTASGQLSAVLPCTDNATLSPGPFTYTITAALEGMPAASYPGKALPRSLGATADLSALLP